MELGKKLTFLVGPNSAGKSIILDLIKLMQGGSVRLPNDPGFIHQTEQGDSVASTASIGVQWQFDGNTMESRQTCVDLRVYYEQEDAYLLKPDQLSQIYVQPHFDLSVDPSGWPIFRGALISEGFLNGVRQYQIAKIGDLEKVDRYPEGSFLWKKFRPKEQIALAVTEKDASKLQSAMMWLEELFGRHSKRLDVSHYLEYYKHKFSEGWLVWDEAELSSLINSGFVASERQRQFNLMGHHSSKVRKMLKVRQSECHQNYPGNFLDIDLVDADRVLPCESDVNATVSMAMRCESAYHELIRSFVSAEWGLDVSLGFEDHPSFGRLPVYIGAEAASLFQERVNRALSDHLFIEAGYQISVESTLRVTKHELEKGVHLLARKGGGLSVGVESDLFDAEMRLIDHQGRSLKFSDVGSGIGYVLPVLMKLFLPCMRGRERLVFLQQPELHLHPALQAALCDVLIDATNVRSDQIGKSSVVCETHSEHLILRALRRIRQTSSGALQDEALKLNPDDLAINYFRPGPDGRTEIFNIRVSPDGEFIDRWPDGFFPERGEELFDD